MKQKIQKPYKITVSKPGFNPCYFGVIYKVYYNIDGIPNDYNSHVLFTANLTESNKIPSKKLPVWSVCVDNAFGSSTSIAFPILKSGLKWNQCREYVESIINDTIEYYKKENENKLIKPLDKIN